MEWIILYLALYLNILIALYIMLGFVDKLMKEWEGKVDQFSLDDANNMLFAIQRLIIPIELSSFDAIYLMDCRSSSYDHDIISVSDNNTFSNFTSDLFP